MGEKCPGHDQFMKDVGDLVKSFSLLQKDVEYLRRDQETILARFGVHVQEAEKEGGRHERLVNAERDLKEIAIKQETDKAALLKQMATEKEAIETAMRMDRIMGRWFMLGSGVLSGGIVAGGIKFLAVAQKILGL